MFESHLRKTAELQTAADAAQARSAFRTTDFNLVILDQRLPDGTGLDLFAEMRPSGPDRSLFSSRVSLKCAMQCASAVRAGLFDYLTKPFENLDELDAVIGKGAGGRPGVPRDHYLRETLDGRRGAPAIIGRSSVMEKLLQQVRQLAPLDVTVLIEGESGSGKEVIAKLLHDLSGRANAPLLELNCGALSESLLEATLFGYEKGAFYWRHQGYTRLF